MKNFWKIFVCSGLAFCVPQNGDRKDEPIKLAAEVSVQQGDHRITLKGRSVYPDGAQLRVELYQVLTGVQGKTESILRHETIKIEKGEFASVLTIPGDFFVPATYRIKVSFQFDSQPGSVPINILKRGLSKASVTVLQDLWIGDVAQIRQMLAADVKIVSDVLDRLERLVPRIVRWADQGSRTAPREERAELDNLARLLKEGHTYVPLARGKAERALRHLYELLGKRTARSRNDGEGEQWPVSSEQILAAMEEAKTSFVREYAFVVVNEVDRLNVRLRSSISDNDMWDKFYARYGEETKKIQSLVADLQKPALFAASYRSVLRREETDLLTDLLDNHRVLAETCHGLMEGGKTGKEVKEDANFMEKERQFLDRRQVLLKKLMP